MTGYDSHLTITVPASMADVAAMVGRAMDPDTGGDKSFTLDESGETVTCRTVCRPEFRVRAMAMIGNARLLHMACQSDYLARWPGATMPTLEQCEAFVALAKVE